MNWLKGHHVGLLLLVVAVVLGSSRAVMADYVFGEPVNMGERVNTPYTDAAPSIAPNGLELYFCSTRPPSTGWDDLDLYVAKRASLDADWGEPVRLPAPLNPEGSSELCPFLAQDGLALYFNSSRPGGYGGMDLWVARRPTLDSPWGEPVNLGPPINTEHDEHRVAVFDGERTIYFSDWSGTRPGSHGWADIYVSTRATTADPWGQPQNLGPVINSPEDEYGPTYISPDGLSAYLTSYFRKGGAGGGDIWIITRPSTSAPWDTMVPVGPPLNSIHPDDWDSEVVFFPAGSMVYMESVRAEGFGEWDLWQAPLVPVVDFNGDKAVDLLDVQALLDHWDTSNSRYDIGPTPLGDGIVDAQDLIVLAEHLFEKPPAPPTPRVSYGSFKEGPAGTFTMTDRSRDIWGLADGFHFAYKTLSGPGSIIARVDSLTNTNPWAKAGMMIRETLDARSKHAFVCVTPDNGVAFQGRDEANPASFNANEAGLAAPHWVKLERDAQGNFTASRSADGAAWQPITGAIPVKIPMKAEVYVGLALTSHTMRATCEAVFSNVHITGTAGAQWSNQDVGIFPQP